MTPGEYIKKKRLAKHMTQKEFGMRAGFNSTNAQNQISRYESGKKAVSVQMALRFSRVLGVQPQTIIKHFFP